jgi:nucleotide-binding universal stress UspA family protein
MTAGTARHSKVTMHSKPYVVLVGMDFSEPADFALRKAIELASRRENSELHVVCIVPQASPKGRHPLLEDQWITAESAVIEGVLVSLRSRVQVELEAFFRSERGDHRLPKRVVPHVVVDVPALGMVQLATDIAADVIVLGSHGQGKARGALGSAAESTLRFAPCAVILVPAESGA